jgi:hypothetical protein
MKTHIYIHFDSHGMAREPTMPKNESLGAELISQARSECEQLKSQGITNMTKYNGINQRYRNRLVKEAGYSYNDAHSAMLFTNTIGRR